MFGKGTSGFEACMLWPLCDSLMEEMFHSFVPFWRVAVLQLLF